MAEARATGLTAAEARDLARLARFMIPAEAALGLPDAGDPAIQADLLGSIGRDTGDVQAALARLVALADGSFATLGEAEADAVAMRLLAEPGPAVAALGRVVLAAYYRDDRVMRAHGRDPRPPFPRGHDLDPGDWSLLETVKGRAPFWRDDRAAPETRDDRGAA